MTLSRLAAIAIALLALAACGTSDDDADGASEVTGVVVSIDGDLTETNGFDLLTPDGERMQFATADGLVFGDNEPISHLQDHFVSGAPVLVRFEANGGSLVAVFVGDAE